MSSVDQTGTQAIRIATETDRRVQFQAIELQIVQGPDEGRDASFSLPIVRIGTASDNDFVLADRAVSRHHAEIRLTPQGLLLRDLGSTNGTYVGSLRVTEVYLGSDTECLFGYTKVQIRQRTEEKRYTLPQQKQLGSLIGGSERMRELYGLLRAVAPTPTTALITGESGSGKEMVARTLHELSGRSGPLVVFDASVTDPEMVRNDLFGHIKGAFTGAAGSREGAFRRAHQGTLFIDEIGELPLDLQPRLLRVLETREVTPIGSDTPVRVDVRVVAATHRDLEAMAQSGAFRADLYYRLSVVPIRMPTLREIRNDIPLLVRHFLEKMELNCQITDEAMQALQHYDWPGNVRELRNVLERAAVLSQNKPIRAEDLHLTQGRPGSASHAPVSHQPPVTSPAAESLPTGSAGSVAQIRDMERQMIIDALQRNAYNKAAVARELGMSLSTLKRRLKDYQL